NLIVEHDELLVFKDIQDAVDAIKDAEQLALIIFAQGMPVNRGVHVARKVMHDGERDRSVEVIVQSRLEIFERARARLLKLRIRLRPLGARSESSNARNARRSRLRSVRSHSRDAERPDQCPLRECRMSRPGISWTSRNIRCASRDDRDQDLYPKRVRPVTPRL